MIPWKRGGAQPNPEMPANKSWVVVASEMGTSNKVGLEHRFISVTGPAVRWWLRVKWWCYESELLETLPYVA